MDSPAQSIVKTLVDAGYVAYYAGGFVRDLLLGKPSADIDIATSAPADVVTSLFSKTIPVGISFGSVIVVQDGEPFEVTTFRQEGPYLDGRHPSTVELGTAEEDAKRRSITINGMFYDPLTDTILDFVGGKKDLKARIIRAIGDPDKRFSEDRLRMIRAVRFATRFNFTIEENTAAAIKKHAHTLFPAVAMERIWQEFQKIADPAFYIELHRFGLLQEIFPELKDMSIKEPLISSLGSDRASSSPTTPGVCEAHTWASRAEQTHGVVGGEGVRDGSRRVNQRFLEERLKTFDPTAPTIGNLMLLFDDHRQEICDRLKVSKKDKQFVSLFERAETLIKGEGDLVDWVHFYAQDEATICLKLLGETATIQPELISHIERVRNKTPLVTAKHLQAIGIEPGKRMGELLKEAERIAITENLSSAEEVLKAIK